MNAMLRCLGTLLALICASGLPLVEAQQIEAQPVSTSIGIPSPALATASKEPTAPSPTSAAPTKPTSQRPTSAPTLKPTKRPSRQPTTSRPTLRPTASPTTERPTTMAPSTGKPSVPPTKAPTTRSPVAEPSSSPSKVASASPSRRVPTPLPTQLPSTSPTSSPTMSPSSSPTRLPSSAPSEVASDMPSNVPSSMPSSSPSVVASVNPSQDPTATPSASPTQVLSNSPSSSPTSFPTTSPTSKMPTESPSIPSKPTAVSATVTPSLDPTNNNVVVVVKEQQQADNGNQPRLPSTATPSPAVVVKEDDTSEEFEAMVTIEIAGISSLLDPSSSLVVENEVVQLLSEEIQEIEGVPVFFLKSKVESQSMFAVDDSGKNDVAIMDLRIHAISVGRGAVDEDLFRERVKLVLQEEKSKDLQKRIRAALLLFSSRGESGGNKDSQAVDITQLQDSGGGGSDINSVILVAIVVFVLIALCVLTIGVVFFVRRNRQKKGIDTHASHDSDHRLDIEKTSSGQSGGSDVDQSVLGSVIIAETKHFNRKGRPKSPSDIESNCSHSSMLSQSNYSESVYTSSPPQISAAPYDETLENIELVEVDEEGPSNVAQIAAITGGRGDTVQTAEMLCQHGRDNQVKTQNEDQVKPQKRFAPKWRRSSKLETSISSTDSVLGSAIGSAMGGATVLNDLILSEAPSGKTRKRSFALGGAWKKPPVPDKPQQQGTLESFTGHAQQSKTMSRKSSTGNATTGSGNDRSVSSLANGSLVTNESVISSQGSRESYAESPHSDDEEKKRGFSEDFSRTQSNGTGVYMSSSESLVSNGSGFSSSDDTDSQGSQSGFNAAFLLKLKQTVSTAVSGNKSDLSKSEQPCLRKMTMSGSSGVIASNSNSLSWIEDQENGQRFKKSQPPVTSGLGSVAGMFGFQSAA